MNTARAVVIVSGGAAISPFTTPEAVCAEGQPAGSTDTFLRAELLNLGYRVFTSPASIGGQQVTNDPGFQGFAAPPPQLPAEVTVNCVGPIDDAGGSLVNFLSLLHEQYGVDEVDLIGHSMGGLFSRAAMGILHRRGSTPVRVRSLATIGSPWQGAFLMDYAFGDLPITISAGDSATETFMVEAEKLARAESQGAAEQVTDAFLSGPNGWNEQQAGVLDDHEVLLIGGTALRVEGGDPRAWPHDGIVSIASSTGSDVSSAVLPRKKVAQFNDLHSILFCDVLELPWERALTWDPAVVECLVGHLEQMGNPAAP